MARLQQQCPGDCSRCEMLAAGEVEMVPCVLDQLFARVQRQEKRLKDIQEALASRPEGLPALVNNNITDL